MEFASSHLILASVLVLLCSARNAITALLKRHAYRSLTVQLYALSLAEALLHHHCSQLTYISLWTAGRPK